MRIALLWFALFSLNSLGTAITAALVGADWATLDAQGRLMIYVAVTVNWTGTVMAFLSKEVSRIKQTGEIIPDKP